MEATKEYQPQEKAAARAAFAANDGNLRLTARQLDIPRSTLRRWVASTRNLPDEKRAAGPLPGLPDLHPKQKEIVRHRARFKVVACGRRFGKTVLGINQLIQPALANFPVAYFVPTYPMLTEVWREAVFVLGEKISRKNAQAHRIELEPGGIIDFWSLDSPDGSRGRKYKRVVIDEAAHIRSLEEAWLKVIRPTLTDLEGDAYFLSTPRGRNFFWECFQRGMDPAQRDWKAWQMPTRANPHIKKTEIAAAERELPKTVFSQEYLAQFLEVGGRYFDEFDSAAHLILDRDIPAHWPKFGGLDYGTAAPFSFHLMASDEDGGVEIFGECYQPGLLPEAQAALIAALLRAKGIALPSCLIAADPSIFPPRDAAKRLGEYPVEAFWRAGLNVMPAVNDRVPGWIRVKEFLHRPGALRIQKGACPNLARTLPLMLHDARNPEDLDTTLEDHALDSARYGLMTRPHQAGAAPSVKTADVRPWFLKETAVYG